MLADTHRQLQDKVVAGLPLTVRAALAHRPFAGAGAGGTVAP